MIEPQRVDPETVHPSLRDDYGDGMPLATYKTDSGVTVNIFGAYLPKDDDERRRRLRRAWDIADGIMARAAERGSI